jgi:hypothetical protein
MSTACTSTELGSRLNKNKNENSVIACNCRICLRPLDPMRGQEKWMCMSDKSRAAWPEAIADDDASLHWFVAKSSFLPKNRRKLLYQRITGNSKRITMCSTNIPARTQMQLIKNAVFYSKNCTKLQENHNFFNEYYRQNTDAKFRPRTKHLLEKRRLFNCRSTRQLEEENSHQTNSA